MNEKEKILSLAEEVFFREGFYKITMDEFASALRMSKKTIYKHFASKDELVKATVNAFMQRIRKEIEFVVDSKIHSLEKVTKIINILRTIGINKITEKWLNDLRLYQPSLWEEIDSFRTKMINRNISKIFSQGVKEGYIVDVPHQIIITIFLSSIQAVINPYFIMNNSFSMGEAIDNTLKILINGILTEKGKKVYKKIIENKKQV